MRIRRASGSSSTGSAWTRRFGVERMFCVTAERARSLGPPPRRAAPPMVIRGGELLGEEFHLCAKPPSLRAKKYEERTGLWLVRINDDWRMYFTIEGDAYVLRAITPHPK